MKMTELDYESLLAFADRIEESSNNADYCHISVSSVAADYIREAVENSKRYLWIKAHAELESYDGSEYCLPTVCAWDYKPGPQLNEQFESLDAAIDNAMRLENEKEI